MSLLGVVVGDGEEWLLSPIDLSLSDFDRGRFRMESISVVSLVCDDKQLSDAVSGAE